MTDGSWLHANKIVLFSYRWQIVIMLYWMAAPIECLQLLNLASYTVS